VKKDSGDRIACPPACVDSTVKRYIRALIFEIIFLQ
jgi:hypothetical protein